MGKVSEDSVPCNNCIHKNVCSVRKCFLETEINTTHPFIMIKLECTEYFLNPKTTSKGLRNDI